MSVLIDTSIWIEYFRNGIEQLDLLLDENIVVTNELILAELIPFLKVKKQQRIISLLCNIKKISLHIDWNQIIEFQYKCLKNGINGLGIPDLIIAQNAKQNHCEIYTQDKHFKLLKSIINLNLTV